MNPIPVNQPLLDGNEKLYLNECIDTGWISSEGPFVKEFETKFASYHGRKHGIAVTNGTAALQCAVDALGLKQGDEVIIPSFTIISCVTAVLQANAKPVLVDCDPLTFNTTPKQVEEAITKKTKAIMLVHIYGLPVDTDPILKLAKANGIKVIEDVAEAIGLEYKNRPCGSLGDISTFSFYPNKHITTGEGGMILTDDDQLAETCKSSRNLCFQEFKRFYHDRIGWNFRMTNLQAAVGLAQLERLDIFKCIKRTTGRKYTKLLEQCPHLQLPLKETDYAQNIYWVYTIVLSEETSSNALSIMEKLNNEKIGTRPFFYPMHLQPIFQKMGLFRGEKYPNAELLAEKGFYIPSGLGIRQSDIEYVANCLIKIIKK
jgi:perosamine synthetase